MHELKQNNSSVFTNYEDLKQTNLQQKIQMGTTGEFISPFNEAKQNFNNKLKKNSQKITDPYQSKTELHVNLTTQASNKKMETPMNDKNLLQMHHQLLQQQQELINQS